MVQVCPVSTKQVNENISRLNAGFTVLMISAYMISGMQFLLIVTIADFILRNIYEGRLNPVIKMNSFIARVVVRRVHLINAGPKIFAARVGLSLSVLGLLLSFISFEAGLIPLAILAIFSLLESIIGFCVACKLYPYLKEFDNRFGNNNNHTDISSQFKTF